MDHITKLLKTCKTELPDCKFIGRSFGEENKKNGTFGWLGDEWFAADLFAPIEKAALEAVGNGGAIILQMLLRPVVRPKTGRPHLCGASASKRRYKFTKRQCDRREMT